MRHWLLAAAMLVGAAGWLSGQTAQTPASAKVAVGFASSPACGMLSAQQREAMLKLPLQDLLDRNAGRYTLMKDDQSSGHYGLDALLARRDVATKPYAALRDAGGVYQTERVIFADPGSGATMMQLSNTPYDSGGDELIYFGKSCWNLDGSIMAWARSEKPSLWGPAEMTTTETHGVLMANGDGTGPRIAFADRKTMRAPICSPVDADLAYSMSGSDLVELDLRAGKVKRVVKSGLPAWWLKISPDGKYALSKGYRAKAFWVVQLSDGKQWDVALDSQVHDSYRFVPGNTDWVMFWYEATVRTEGMRLVNFKTGEQKTCKMFDWNHGDVGRYMHFHVGGYINPYDAKNTTWQDAQHLFWPDNDYKDIGPYYPNPASVGGYAAHWPDDQLWGLGVVYTYDPTVLGEVSGVFAKPFPEGGRVNRFRVCYVNSTAEDWRKQKSIVLSRPNLSPDGTKLLFNTNTFGRCMVYMVVARLPQPPRNVTAKAGDQGVTVNWEPPRNHSEIKGYLVYRSSESGRGFSPVTDKPVSGASYTDMGAKAGQGLLFYAVRSVENSRLESGLSSEAIVAVADTTPVRIFVEAEAAIRADLEAPSPDALWVNFDGLASDMHYIWQRRKDKEGKVSLEVDVPREGRYFVVARVKGSQGVAFKIGGCAVAAPASAEWAWATSAEPVALKAGKQALEIASTTYGSCLDCFYLAGDKDFKPAGRILAETPEPLQLTAAPAGAGQAKLSWEKSAHKRWSHFNLYCSDKAGFTPDHTTLVASPDANTFLDWQAGRGTRYYRVTQVSLDGLESKPSNEVKVDLE